MRRSRSIWRDAQGAADLLAGFRPLFDQTDKGPFQAEYFKTYGEALLALDRDGEAEPLLGRALAIGESDQRESSEEAVRLSWTRMQSQLYHDILAIKLKRGNASESLAWWEWYRGASLRTPRTKQSFDPRSTFSHDLAANTAVISYVLDSRGATAFVYRQREVQVRSLPLTPGISPLIASFLRHCSTPTSDLRKLDSESDRLYEMLLAPLEADLQGIAALRIETDGALDRVPFDLLHRSGEPYIGDRYDISFSPGMAYSRPLRSEEFSSSSAALIVAAPDPEPSALARLPEAADEAAEVAACFRGAKMLSGAQAKREEVLRDLKVTELFHFAGHAKATVRGAGLVLAEDSRLDADDVGSLRLPNLKLAVLSACDTANGSDDSPTDVNSLARTLVAAGASSVVASRWTVDSAAARQMMHAFYAELLSGKDPGSSLHAAQIVLRNTNAYRHPYYWASLALFRSQS